MLEQDSRLDPDRLQRHEIYEKAREKRIAVEQRFLSLRNELPALSQAENASAPLGRLSDDILLEIFITVRDEWFNRGPGWARLAHVCRRWRAVALLSGAFWNKFQITSFTKQTLIYVFTCLRYSRRCPLTIWVNTPKICSEEHAAEQRAVQTKMVEFIKSQAYRVVLLDVNLSGQSDVIKWIDFTMPALKHLELACDVPIKDPLPPEVQDALDLKRAACQLEAFRTIARTESHHGELLDGLSRCENLRELKLACTAVPEKDGPFGVVGRRTVSLPKLHTLEIDDSGDTTLYLLEHLIVPHDCVVNCYVAEDVPAPLIPIPSSWASLREMRSLLVTFEHNGLHVLASKVLPHGLDIYPDEFSFRTISSTATRPLADEPLARPHDLSHILDEVAMTFSSCPLEVLQICLWDPAKHPRATSQVTTAQWDSLLSTFPSLRRLVVTAMPQRSPDTSLALLQTLGSGAASGSMKCPQLTELVLSDDVVYLADQFYDVVVECLDARQAAGKPLSLLCFAGGAHTPGGGGFSAEQLKNIQLRVQVEIIAIGELIELDNCLGHLTE
ncbi:hypothetical protein OBBRIDRAFT_804352 [Obba rivulosa]|uniref:F-box domain-containing protein n=1 Tax=Obba rivulosa TaxID=1052685 RepID=A0A8E2ASQ9_9APHY|nr:hypothetical protein OBBRIDRAFT_804352 [Obba rivulosa]